MKPRGAPHERRWVVRVPGVPDTCGAHRASDDTWELALRAPFSTALVEVLRSLGGGQRSRRELAAAMGALGLDYAAVLAGDSAPRGRALTCSHATASSRGASRRSLTIRSTRSMTDLSRSRRTSWTRPSLG